MKDHFTYRVTWSAEDGEHVGLCAEFPSLSWLAATPEASLKGIRKVVAQIVEDLRQSGEEVPEPFSDRRYSGRFMVRVPPEVHRGLATRATEEGVSLNRLVSAKLAAEGGRYYLRIVEAEEDAQDVRKLAAGEEAPGKILHRLLGAPRRGASRDVGRRSSPPSPATLPTVAASGRARPRSTKRGRPR
jgi:predicted HicB family RNase H-like nuclease